MALKDNLTSVRYYTQYDPYYYSVDNRPITDLRTNVEQVADALDALVATVDVTGGVSPIVNKISSLGGTTWTVTRNGVGDYTITHNTGFQYSVVGTARDASGPFVVYVYASNTSSVSIKTVNLSNTATDIRFACIFSKI